MAQKLASSLGLAVGISSGANFIGALMVQNEMDCGNNSISGRQQEVSSTDLLREEKVKPGYLTPEVELLGYEAIKRVCYTCFDEDE